ncbi:MAG: hypothetical protein C5B59_03330 [Bacteroidetes bacterium]|nr:MAG: hypothetical protein C5B59_03330 [Bacteroidota bacterium]
MKKLIVALGLVAFYSVGAQNVTGYWYGQANVEMSGIQNNYLTELIIAQKGNKVKGFFGYYFKDVYQSFLVKGVYDPRTKQIIIRDIPIIYFATNSTSASVDCITNFYGKMMVSKVKTTLSGYFMRDKKYTYTCPDLRVSYTLFTEAKVEDSIFKDLAATRQYWKPSPITDNNIPDASSSTSATRQDNLNSIAPNKENNAIPIASKKDDATNSTVSKKDGASNPTAVNKEAATIAVAANSNTKTDKSPETPQAKDPSLASSAVTASLGSSATFVKPDIAQINDQFKKRKQLLGKVLEVASDSLRLSFYDNAEIDGDSISVFLNGELIMTHQELTERAINVYIKLDSLKDFNEVSMFAENLGKYPPNTAVMVVSDGERRYEVFMSSDLKGSATVRFKRKKSNEPLTSEQ